MRRYFLISLFLFFIITSKAQAAALPIYISQVQTTGGAGKTNNDFIELFNPNSTTADLKGYRLVKRAQNGTTDSDIKSFTKDVDIPPESFFLWANSAYTTVSVVPDVTTSADISDDNGVALRFGADNTGTIIDSVAWGNANNGFTNVSKINPGAGQSLQRKNLLSSTSSYTISQSKPHNSSTNDLAAALAQSQAKPTQSAVQIPLSATEQTTPTVTSVPTEINQPIQPTAVSVANNQVPLYKGDDQTPSTPSSAKNYLFLAAAAFLALIILTKQFFFTKVKAKRQQK